MRFTTLLAVCAAGTCAGVLPAQTLGSFVSSGEGCPTANILYERFDFLQADLSGTSIEFAPQAVAGYRAAIGGSMLSFGSGTNLNLGDDQVSPALSLGFALQYPAGVGTTTQIEVSSNGYVYLEPGTIGHARCCNGGLEDFRSETPSFALFGMDLQPDVGGTVWFDTAPGVAYVTFDSVPEYSELGANTCQIQFHSDNRVVMCWGTLNNQNHQAIVGWSSGNGVADPGPVDLSGALPILLSAGSPLMITGSNPTIGETFNLSASNVPPTSSLGVLLLGGGQLNIDLGLIDAPGCRLLTTADITSLPMVITPPTAALNWAIPNDPNVVGAAIESQAAIVAPGINGLGVVTSNRGTMTFGDFSPVFVTASGTNSFNSNTASGFFRIENGSTLQITDLVMSFAGLSSNIEFDTDQGSMADRFDGGNSLSANCRGTYRSSSDTATGLIYSGTPAAPCDSNAQSGWIGTDPGNAARDWRTLTFAFNSFDPGDVFEFDADTDGGTGVRGGDMAGMSITVTLSDGSVRSGQLVRIDANNSAVNL